MILRVLNIQPNLRRSARSTRRHTSVRRMTKLQRDALIILGVCCGLVVAGALCELCVFARRRRHWLAEQRRRRDAATSVILPVALVPEDDAPTAPLTSPRRRQSQAAATDVL